MKKMFALPSLALLFVLASPVTTNASTSADILNVASYVFNSVDKLKLKDIVHITERLVIDGNLNVKGEVKNSTSGKGVIIDDDLKVKGNLTIKDGGLIDGVDVSTLPTTTTNNISLDTGSGLVLNSNVLSLQKTCTEGQILKYNATSIAWECSSDVATVSGTSMTIGSGLSLNESGVLSVSGITSSMISDATITSVDLANDVVGANQLTVDAIQPGDLGVDDLPSGGTWTLSSNLAIDGTTMIVDPTNNRLGIGGVPRSPLYVADGNYAQFANHGVSDPSDADCDADAEIGRLYIQQPFGLLWVCNGSLGWGYISLTEAAPAPL